MVVKLVFHGAPQTAIDELDGKVYQKVVEREELEQVCRQLCGYFQQDGRRQALHSRV
jgi:hypothetical protein